MQSPPACAQSPDFGKYRIAIEQLASVRLFNAAPNLGTNLLKSGVPRLFAFLEQTQAFAHHLTRGLISA